MTDIFVRSSGRVPFQSVNQDIRGTTRIIEQPVLPFPVRRVYVIQDVRDPTLVRGNHAHRLNDQVIFIVRGSMTLTLDDGERSQELALSAGEDGIRLMPYLWHSMKNFTPDCIAVVLASHPYDPKDYISDYDVFKNHVRSL